MKKTLLILTAIIFSSCSSGDQDSYYQKTIQLSVNNYIKVYTQNNYNVGDKIFIESRFNKLQDEPGYSNKLDIFKTTNTRQYGFYISLEKKVFNGSWTTINLNNTDFESGGLGNYNFNNGICELNPTNTFYEFYKGLILQESGQYRLTISSSIDPFYGNNYYYNYSGGNNISVSFNTTIENVPGNSYLFTVN